MSDLSTKEIPGYYRDPATGKYFRKNPNDAIFSKLQRLNERDNQINLRIPKTTHLPGYLKRRELGFSSGILAEDDYYRIKTHDKKVIQNISLNTVQPFCIYDVEYITGGDDSNYGMWIAMEKGQKFYVTGENNFYTNRNQLSVPFRSCKPVMDMCPGPEETIVAVYTIPFSIFGCFEFLDRTSFPPVSLRSNFKFGESVLFSCCAMQKNYSFIMGSDVCISYYNGFRRTGEIPVTGKVYTLSFDASSNILVSGLHHGGVFVHDFRTMKTEARMQISDIGIKDSVIINQKQVIVTDIDGMLVNVDFRMMDVVANYFGHKHTVKKSPLSFANNMLCASGADNVVRIWHVSGGNPIHEIAPLEYDGCFQAKGWLHEDGTKTYLNYFEGRLKKVIEII